MLQRAGVVATAVWLALAVVAAPTHAATPRLISVGSFATPVYVTAPAGDVNRVFVGERDGHIQVLDGGVKHQFADLTGVVLCCDGERGLLSIAFAPDYATSGLFYVAYTAKSPTGAITVAEYRRSAGDPDAADPSSARIVLTIPHDRQDNHDGGQLQFGPDGDLYVGTGDGGSGGDPAGNGQNLTQTSPATVNGVNHSPLLGKILRIDPRGGRPYAIPAGNPFPAPASEVFTYGLRNPWRFSFDRATGDLTIGDVGQDAYEEVDFAPAPGHGLGANYGWSRYEGFHTYDAGTLVRPPYPAGFTFPVIERSHSGDGYCAITGGYVVRDPALPELAGQYVYGDFCNSAVRAATLTAGGATNDHPLGLSVPSLSSFGEDGCGRVYAISLDGPVYRLGTTGTCAGPSVPFGGAGTAPPAGGTPGGGPAAPAISIGDARVRERDAHTRLARFTIRLSPSASTPVSVDARTRRGTARAPGDYRAVHVRLTFAPAQTTRVLWVRVKGDRIPERDEHFTVALADPSSPATIADGRGRGTITDDDPAMSRIRVRRTGPHAYAFRTTYHAPGRAVWRFADAARGRTLKTRRLRIRHAGRATTLLTLSSRVRRVNARLTFTTRTHKRQVRTRAVRVTG